VSFLAALVRRAGPRLFGPPLPALAAMWQAGGRRGVTAAICVVVPLVAGTLASRPDLGAAAALSAFTAIYGHALPYRRRAIVVAGVAGTLAAAAGLGALTGGHPVALSLVCGALAACAAVATSIWRVGPPGPIGVVLVCGGSSALGTTPSLLGGHLLAAIAGVTLAWCACMLPWLWDPTGPERRAVDAAEHAVAAVERNGLGDLRPGALATAVRAAATAMADASRRDDGSLWRRMDDVEQRFLEVLPAGPGSLPGSATPDVAPEPGPVTDHRWWHTTSVATAARLGVAAAAAGLIATAIGLPNPYWAATSAVAVQLGIGVRSTLDRAVYRAAGTVAGVLVAALIISADLPVGVQIALVGLLQLAVELLVAHKYGLAVALITPMVLTLVHIGVPARSGADLIGERLSETAIGIALGLAAGLLLFRQSASRRLPGAVSAATRATTDAARDPTAGRRLHDVLLGLSDIAVATRAELSPAPGTEAWLKRARSVADLGWALLGARARGEDHIAAAVTGRITADLGSG
jgi:hypothetical protein